MSSFIKVMFVVHNDEDLRRKLLRFWDELASTTGWGLTGYGDWAVDSGSVSLPGVVVITAREAFLKCYPDAAEAILLAHHFVRVKSIQGHQSDNTRYFKAPPGSPPAVRLSFLPNPSLNYPHLFKVIIGGNLTSQAMLRMRWREFWHRVTETKGWQRTNFTQFSFHNNTIWVATYNGNGHYAQATEILERHGFRANPVQMGEVPEFHPPLNVPKLRVNDLRDPKTELVKVFFCDETPPDAPLPRPRLRKFMDDLEASRGGARAGYNWHFSRDNEILFSAKSNINCYSELSRLLLRHSFDFVGYRQDAPVFQAPLKIPGFREDE